MFNKQILRECKDLSVKQRLVHIIVYSIVITF